MFPKGVSLLQLIPSEPCAATNCPVGGWRRGGGEFLLISLCLSFSHWQSFPMPWFPVCLPVSSDIVTLLCCTSNPFHLSHILCNCSLSIYPSLRSFLLSSSPFPHFAFCPFELPLLRSLLPQRGDLFMEQRGEMLASNVRRQGQAAAPMCPSFLGDLSACCRICQQLCT